MILGLHTERYHWFMHNILHCVCDPYLSPFLPAAQCKKHESSALYKYKAPRVPPWLSQCGNTGLARPLTRSVLRLTDPPSVGRSDGWSVARGGCVRGRQETIIVFAVFAASARSRCESVRDKPDTVWGRVVVAKMVLRSSDT